MHIKVAPMGDIIRNARLGKQLSQEKLAERIGVSKKTILAIENDKRFPSYEVFYRLVHALDISADSIVFPDRAALTAELDQTVNELLTCGKHKQKIVIDVVKSLLRALRHDEPEKQG